jgi:hypothetical protein
MIDRRRSRRLGALLAGVGLVITFAGCTVGTTSIPAGQAGQAIACRASAPTATIWVPGPEAQYLRFEVLSSDATEPLRAVVFGNIWGGGEGGADFGTVWDGTKSTGPKQVPLPNNLIPLVIMPADGPATQTIQVTWSFTALDANGKDVGFTCLDDP